MIILIIILVIILFSKKDNKILKTRTKVKLKEANTTKTVETTLYIPKVILPNTLQDKNNNPITDLNGNFTESKKLVGVDLKNEITDVILKQIKEQLIKIKLLLHHMIFQYMKEQ